MTSRNPNEERLQRKYSYPEFLQEFFPNVHAEETDEEVQPVLTDKDFFNILEKVVTAKPVLSESGVASNGE